MIKSVGMAMARELSQEELDQVSGGNTSSISICNVDGTNCTYYDDDGRPTNKPEAQVFGGF